MSHAHTDLVNGYLALFAVFKPLEWWDCSYVGRTFSVERWDSTGCKIECSHLFPLSK